MIEPLRRFFQPRNELSTLTEHFTSQYLEQADIILFEGIYHQGERPLFITQTSEQHKVLPKEILLADVYIPCNRLVTQVIGNISKSSLRAYAVGNQYGRGEGIPEDLEERIVAKEAGEAPHILPGIEAFSDILPLIRNCSRRSYSLKKLKTGKWSGKEIDYTDRTRNEANGVIVYRPITLTPRL